MTCDRCSAMHRRAQDAEARAVAAERRPDDALATVMHILCDLRRRKDAAEEKARRWHASYRDAVRQLQSAGVPDHNDPPWAFYRTGMLKVLIERALRQRAPEHEECRMAIDVRDEEIKQLRKRLSERSPIAQRTTSVPPAK